jgi:hypothetical protein
VKTAYLSTHRGAHNHTFPATTRPNQHNCALRSSSSRAPCTSSYESTHDSLLRATPHPPPAPSQPSTLLNPAQQHHHHRVPTMSADESHGKIVTMVARFTAVYPLGSMGIAPAKLLYKYLRDAELKLVRRCGDLQRSIKRLARHGRNVVKDRLWMLRRFRGGFVYTFEIAADLHAAIKDEVRTGDKTARESGILTLDSA